MTKTTHRKQIVPTATHGQTPAKPAPAPAPLLVTSLDQIQAHHREPIGIVVSVCGQPYRFEGRRLLPHEDHQIADLLQRALPTRIAGEAGAEDRYDFEDPEYQRTKQDFERKARALALWLGFPVFAADAIAAGKQLKDQGEICAFIESRSLDVEVLDALFGALTLNTVSVSEFTGFTSGSSSRPN